MAARAACRCGWTGGPYRSQAKAEASATRHVCRDGGVRRATRRFRCKRCGLEAVYDNAGAAESRYWFGKHSCQKHEQLMLRAALAEDQRALIDRTPKPCLHKQANHQHGTNAAYHLDACHCIPCANAANEYANHRNRMIAYGQWNQYVPGEFVRDHIAKLAEYGIGLKRVAELSGVATGTLSKIVFGVYPDTGTGGGRNGPGIKVREPSRRVLRKNAEAIYAIEPIPANLSPGVRDHERTPLARVHLRALVALGWSQSKLAVRLGLHPTNLGPVINDGRTLSRGTVDRIEAMFAELCMTVPPEHSPRERAIAAATRRFAAERGWLPPLALDDEDDLQLIEEAS